MIRSKHPDFETRIFSSLGIVDKCNTTNNNMYSWRLDYRSGQEPESNEDERFVILISQKIILRGKKVLLSSNLENKLRKLFNYEEDVSISDADFNHFVDTNTNTPYEFDSPLEKHFFEKVLPEKLGPFFKKYVLYQAQVIDNNSYSRVDFLLNQNIVIELDGEEHNEQPQQDHDNDRDTILMGAGYTVIRIPNEDIENGNLEQWNIPRITDERDDKITPQKKIVLAAKLILQIQVVLSEIIYSYGFNTTIYFDSSFQPFDADKLKQILSLALEDFKELSSHIIKLYGLEISPDTLSLEVLQDNNIPDSPIITFDENKIHSKSFIIQDIVYNKINTVQDRILEEKDIENSSKKIIQFFLNYIFRHKELRDGQLETIQRVLEKKDTITLLPTGAGKSICFQLPSFLFIGNTLIICPITSLMDDQVENLRDKHHINKAIAIHSKQEDREQLRSAFISGKNIFTYISPERFQNKEFREDVQNLRTTIPISLIAIDEAHCLSEWGHDFRVAYLHIGKLTRQLTDNAPVLALTGTASYSVLNDIKRDLNITQREAIITPKTFDRKEIDFFIVSDHGNIQTTLINILQQVIPARLKITAPTFKNNSQKAGIIFCPHTRGPYGRTICNNLEQAGFVSAFYSATMRRQNPQIWQQTIKENARQFKKNKLPLLVATKAFGMGIDKPNIRYTIHYGIPPSIEAYYQEAGRAGRDRQPAVSYIIFSNKDDNRNEKILDLNTSFEEIREMVQGIRRRDQDDIIRQIGFHVGFYRNNTFTGGNFISIEKETQYLNNVVTNLFNGNGDIIKYNKNEDRLNKEKALYRLSILGVVSDYTINRQQGYFDITLNKTLTNEQILGNYTTYLASYNRSKVRLIIEPLKTNLENKQDKFIRIIGENFIKFIYDNIEKSRRRSLREMFLLAKRGLNEQNLVRKRILNYLETNYSEEIEELIKNDSIFGDDDITHLKNMIEGYEDPETGEMKGGIRTSKEAAELRGTIIRYLESDTDQPELLFLRSVSELFCTDCNEETVITEFKNCINNAQEKYEVETSQITKSIILFLEEVLFSQKESLTKKVFELELIKNNIDIINMIFKHHFENINVTKYAFYNLINNKLKNYIRSNL